MDTSHITIQDVGVHRYEFNRELNSAKSNQDLIERFSKNKDF